MNKNKGFTLIELLVVIAIIGILASVVMANLMSAREKSSDAAVKSNLKSAAAQAEIFAAENNFSFTGVCSTADKSIRKMAEAAALAVGLTAVGENATGSLTTVTCNATPTNWAIEVPLKIKTKGGMFCVDSKGFVGEKSTSILNTAFCQ